MRSRLKKSMVILASATMFGVILLNFPSNTFKSFTASAADELTVVIDNGSTIIRRGKDNNGYYDIGTADKLYAFAAIVNGSNNSINAELTDNIDNSTKPCRF